MLVSGTTIGASVEQCFNIDPNGCADDNGGGGFCYEPYATVWYKFTTNASGGNVTAKFTNLVKNTDPLLGQELQVVMVLSDVPCEGGNYSYASQCINNGVTDFLLTSAFPLDPNTTYYIQVNGSGEIGITQPAEITFDLMLSGDGIGQQPLSVNISADDVVLCQNDRVPVYFEFNNCSGNRTFNWYFNGELFGDEPVFQTSSLEESGYLFLEASCGTLGCPNPSSSDSIFFDVTPIKVNAGPDILIGIDGATIIEGSGIGDPSWDPTTNLVGENTFTPTSSANDETTYTLTVINGDCELSDQMIVFLKSPINIPSGFTPNGDGNNDFWDIEFLEQYIDNQVIIYDRSGQVIYKTVGYNNGITSWDGTYKDNPVPASTYFYFIDLRDGKENSIFKGPVTVIR
jgi:gliding motility-associated-like protein